MTIESYQADIAAIIAHRHDQGADLWTTADNRIGKGAPFSLLESCQYLSELDLSPDEPILQQAADLIWAAWQPDGRFRIYKGAIYPCQTITAAQTLCRLGCAEDERLQTTFQHLLTSQFQDGGWRCNKFSFGRGPETAHSNPLPTLLALDAFRFSRYREEPAFDAAIDFLLTHWTTKAPIGPCHYGIGTLFMQVEYPFRNYNLFLYVYVLSYYPHARKDERFLDALAALQAKLVDDQIVVERVVPKLGKLHFCKKGAPSELATRRYQEILANLAKGD